MTKKDTVKVELPKAGQIVRVRAHRDGYRRAGLQLTKKTQDFPADKLTPAQIDQLGADPNLVVVYVDPAKK